MPAGTPGGPADIADQRWAVNSRNTADEAVVRTLASLAGFVPRIAHGIDRLELVVDYPDFLRGYARPVLAP